MIEYGTDLKQLFLGKTQKDYILSSRQYLIVGFVNIQEAIPCSKTQLDTHSLHW